MLGYAIRALSWDRVLLVMNAAYSSPEALPFDLRTKRAITYTAVQQVSDRTAERRQLASQLERRLRDIFGHLEQEQKPTDVGVIDRLKTYMSGDQYAPVRH